MSSQPTAGSTRRASRSSPAAFCARAPRAQVAPRSSGPPSQRRASRAAADRPGRPGSGPSTKWAGDAAGSTSTPASVPSSRRHEPASASAGVRATRRVERAAATVRLQLGSQVAVPTISDRAPAASASSRSASAAVLGQRLDRPGHHPGAAQQRLPSATPAPARRRRRRPQPARSSTSTGRPTSAAPRPRGRRPIAGAALAHVDQPLPAAEGAGQPGGVAAVRDAASAQQADQGRVGGVVAEQVGGDPVRHPQRPGQERPVGVLDRRRRPRSISGAPGRAGPGRPPTRPRRRPARAPARPSPAAG